MTTPPDLHELRRRARAARRAIDGEDRTRREGAIVSALVGLDELTGPVAVGWSLPTDGEVDLSGATEPLIERGVSLWLPVVGPDVSMRFARFTPGDRLVRNRYGIAEPADDAVRCDADALDVVVVPCVAVDLAGNRLGFGAGYYDRALAARGSATTVGAAFEAQVVAELDPDPWDVALDVVVTEERVDPTGAPNELPAVTAERN